MSISSIQATTAIQDLSKAITSRYDADGDGRLSSDEFTGFLSSFLGGLNISPLAAAAKAGLPSATAALAPVAERSRLGTMAGFDAGKLADMAHTTPKYQIGRILQYYPHTPDGLKSALPELQQLVPGVAITGTKGDKLDFGGYVSPEGITLGVNDVIQAAGLGGTAWQWAPD